MLLESQVLFLLYAAHEAIKQRYRLGRQVALSPTSSTSTMLILPSDRDNPNKLNLTDYESVALCTQLVFQQVAVAYSQILYLANTSQTNTTLFIPRVLTDYCTRLQKFYLSLPSTDTLSALVPASLENLSNASAAAFLVPIIASMQLSAAPIAPTTAPLLLPSSNSSSLALVTIDESNTNTWEYWMPYIAMTGLLLYSGFAFRDKLFSVFHSFFERKESTSAIEVLPDTDHLPSLIESSTSESKINLKLMVSNLESSQTNLAAEIEQEFIRELYLIALQKAQEEALIAKKTLLNSEVLSHFTMNEDDKRIQLTAQETTSRQTLFTSRNNPIAIQNAQGKSYFDDYIEDEKRNRISNDVFTKTIPHEKTLTHVASKTSINSSQSSTPTSKSASHKPSTKTEFSFQEKENQIRIVRESKPLDETTKKRSVIWRFEGKSQLSIEQKYRELVEKALAFRLAEQKALQEEIAELRNNSSNPARLAELELLDEKLKPTEITFSVPNQKEADRIAVDKTEFAEFEISEGEIKLTEHELLALKAHLQCFDVVRFGEMTFSRKPGAVLQHNF